MFTVIDFRGFIVMFSGLQPMPLRKEAAAVQIQLAATRNLKALPVKNRPRKTAIFAGEKQPTPDVIRIGIQAAGLILGA
jgi:hypothetical protein